MKGYYYVLTDFFSQYEDGVYGSELLRSGLYPTYTAALHAAYDKRDDLGYFCEIDVRSI